MNRGIPGFIRSHALVDAISVFSALFLMEKIGSNHSIISAHSPFPFDLAQKRF
jgi:hypothetical protein